MAALAGNGGAVKLSTNTVAHLNDWELNTSANIMDITAFGDDWKKKLGGILDWTVKCSGDYDLTDTNGQHALWTALTGLTTVALKLFVDGTVNFNGAAFVKTFAIKAAVEDKITIDFELEGSDTLTLTES